MPLGRFQDGLRLFFSPPLESPSFGRVARDLSQGPGKDRGPSGRQLGPLLQGSPAREKPLQERLASKFSCALGNLRQVLSTSSLKLNLVHSGAFPALFFLQAANLTLCEP